MDIHALRKRGWTISAIARHVGRDRKTVRAYLEGKRQVGQRVSGGGDSFARFTDRAAARLKEDPHLRATALHDEVVALGYERSYPSFTRALRLRGLRPACEPCHPATGRPAAVIEHPAGEEALCGIPHNAMGSPGICGGDCEPMTQCLFRAAA